MTMATAKTAAPREAACRAKWRSRRSSRQRSRSSGTARRSGRGECVSRGMRMWGPIAQHRAPPPPSRRVLAVVFLHPSFSNPRSLHRPPPVAPASDLQHPVSPASSLLPPRWVVSLYLSLVCLSHSPPLSLSIYLSIHPSIHPSIYGVRPRVRHYYYWGGGGWLRLRRKFCSSGWT